MIAHSVRENPWLSLSLLLLGWLQATNATEPIKRPKQGVDIPIAHLQDDLN
jgi:hypothetical protein